MHKLQCEIKTEGASIRSPYQAEREGAYKRARGSSGRRRKRLALSGTSVKPSQNLRTLQRQYGKRAIQRMVVQRQDPRAGFQLDNETAGRINRARGGGQPLDRHVAEQMGDRMGHDFSGVRVHADQQADRLSRQLNARAFTTGQDVFFRQWEYKPGARDGQELIAHELRHVMQQSQGRVPGVGSGMMVRPAGDALEQEAGAQQLGEAREPVQERQALQRAVTRPSYDTANDKLALQGKGGHGAIPGLMRPSLTKTMEEELHARPPAGAKKWVPEKKQTKKEVRDKNAVVNERVIQKWPKDQNGRYQLKQGKDEKMPLHLYHAENQIIGKETLGIPGINPYSTDHKSSKYTPEAAKDVKVSCWSDKEGGAQPPPNERRGGYYVFRIETSKYSHVRWWGLEGGEHKTPDFINLYLGGDYKHTVNEPTTWTKID